MISSTRALCLLALSLPLCGAAACLAAVSAGERAGVTPFAGLTPRNSAEAAAMGSAADTLRFLRAGDDPRRVYPIDPAIISSSVLRATTLEAALWSRQVEMIRLLDREGAIGDGDREALGCLAADLGVDDVREYLSPEGAAQCDAGAAFARVLARTASAAAGAR